MQKLDTYNKYVKEYAHLFDRDFEGGLSNPEIIELANAIKQVNYMINAKAKNLRNIYEYQKKCLTFPEYDERHKKTFKGHGKFYFDAFVENINSVNFFELLTSKRKKNAMILFRTDNHRDDFSASSFKAMFKQFKLICDEYDDYFNNQEFYIKRFLDAGESTKDKVVAYDRQSLYIGYFDESGATIEGLVYNIKHTEDGVFDFHTVEFSVPLEKIDNKYYQGLNNYIKEFYPEYIV